MVDQSPKSERVTPEEHFSLKTGSFFTDRCGACNLDWAPTLLSTRGCRGFL